MRSIDEEQRQKCKFYYSATSQNNLPYFEEMKNYSESGDGHVISLTKEEAKGFEYGRITDKLRARLTRFRSLNRESFRAAQNAKFQRPAV